MTVSGTSDSPLPPENYPQVIHLELAESEIVYLDQLAVQDGNEAMHRRLRSQQLAAFARWHG